VLKSVSVGLKVDQEISEQELLERYAKAQEWAVNELSLKYKVPFKANVSLTTQFGKFDFDAYADSSAARYIAEVKYWQANKSDKLLKLSIQKFLSKHRDIESVFKRNSREFKLMIVLVYDSLIGVDKQGLIDFAKDLYEEVEVEFFDFEELGKGYW